MVINCFLLIILIYLILKINNEIYFLGKIINRDNILNAEVLKSLQEQFMELIRILSKIKK